MPEEAGYALAATTLGFLDPTVPLVSSLSRKRATHGVPGLRRDVVCAAVGLTWITRPASWFRGMSTDNAVIRGNQSPSHVQG